MIRKISKKMEDIFTAAAFAEAGEHETARQIMKESDRESGKRKEKDMLNEPLYAEQ